VQGSPIELFGTAAPSGTWCPDFGP